MAALRRWAIASALAGSVAAQDFSIDSRSDTIQTADTLASDLMALYQPGGRGRIPGLLPGDDYYWWQAAGFMASFIEYWRSTGDDSHNDIIRQGMLWQTGQNDDFMPANQTATMANDDQCHWALAAMMAAEYDFPAGSGDAPQWLDLARNVFEEQSERFDAEEECGGGLRWTIFPTTNGFNYKSVSSNACFFDLSARLARYTGNSTYAEAADDVWEWMTENGFVDTRSWRVYEGAMISQDCELQDINRIETSSNSALVAHGAAVLYNHTNGDNEWRQRLTPLVERTMTTFFPDGIAVERSCETLNTCTLDQFMFKGLTHRLLAGVTQLAPSLAADIAPSLRSSAQAAIDQCTGGDSGRQCGFFWANGTFVEPESSGIVEQMDVLAAVSGLLATAPQRAGEGGEQGGNEEGSSTDGDDEPSNRDTSDDAAETPSAAERTVMSLSISPPPTMYECQWCDDTFWSLSKYEDHMDYENHWPECETCTKDFGTYKACIQHMDATNHWAPRFPCETCNKDFGSLHAAEQHMDATSHWAPRFPCETCTKDFSSSHAAEQHMTATGHWRPKVPCETCTKNFGSLQAAQQHMTATGHWKPRVPCETCTAKFHTQSAANQHMQAKGHFASYCKRCDQQVQNANKPRMVRDKHLNSETHQGASIACPFCGAYHTTVRGVVHHVETGSCPKAPNLNHATILRLIREMLTASSPTYWECYICHEEFDYISGLNNHLNSPVQAAKDRAECAKEFQTLASLFNHLESESCQLMRFDRVQQQMGNVFSGRKFITFS
ncbi:glycosyl hydrolase family 76-domain-containing protein [Stachybotrys elegans]|uniref:mannan endo-1,6-alpha-mannosidase n=1 Tax=Stachybotrys elegans TaxID=80388 RepID=A0A8K0SV07_9HYPO|nr:glycosyl hydrolase family 76-domain-containing protein [Stachybotrys elegans]